jgi:hypothetical protein
MDTENREFEEFVAVDVERLRRVLVPQHGLAWERWPGTSDAPTRASPMRSAPSTVESQIAAHRSAFEVVVPLDDVSTDRSSGGNRRWVATAEASLILVVGVVTTLLTRIQGLIVQTVGPAQHG